MSEPQIARISEALEAAVAAGRTVGCVGLLADSGGLRHVSAHGRRAADAETRMTPDTVFQLASMTKAIGTVAAMKLVEDGRLSLESDVAEILPDFAQLQVLQGFDGDVPRFRPSKRPCTIRHLMTHTSGLGYDAWNPDQFKLCAQLGVNRRTGGRPALQAFPFLREPGEKWEYGVSIDWLGLVVEQVTGEPIQAFLQREILGPLGMGSTDVIFRPDMADRKTPVHVADAQGRLTPSDIDITGVGFYSMGGCMKGTGPDYARFLRMFLRGGELDGARVLRPETVEAMSVNAIGDLRLCTLPSAAPGVAAPVEFFPGVEKTFTLGFMRNEERLDGRRHAGSLSWAGLFNTYFWIDPTVGIAGVLMMQQAPFSSPEAMAVYDSFERAVYAGL